MHCRAVIIIHVEHFNKSGESISDELVILGLPNISNSCVSIEPLAKAAFAPTQGKALSSINSKNSHLRSHQADYYFLQFEDPCLDSFITFN